MDLLRNMFSPQKPADAEQPQRASPLIEGHPNRVQKPRQKNRAASRKGATRAPRLPARILGSPELGEERDQEPSKVSRRHSEFPRPAARLNDLSSDDEHNQTITEGISVSVTTHDDDGADSSIGFASQPAHLQSLLTSETQIVSTQEEIVASTDPDEEMHDAEEDNDEGVAIGLVESEQSEIESEPNVQGVEAKDDGSAITSEITPVSASASVSEITPAPASEVAPEDDASESDAADLITAEPEEEEKEEEKEEEEEQGEEEAGDVTINRMDGQYSFTDILEHRWAGDEVELKVGWYHGPPTWEPESILHADAPDSLFSYWRGQGGRPTNPRDPDIFDIFAIRGHSHDKKKLLVEWTGYEPTENIWVPRNVVQDTAPDVVAEYWKSIKKAPKATTTKAKAPKEKTPKAKTSKAKTAQAKTSKAKPAQAKTSKAKPAQAKTTRAKTSNAKVTKSKAPARRKR